MLCSGGLLGMLYDICRIFAKEFRFTRFLTLIVDFLYWAAAAVIVFKLLYTGNYGELRVYVFIGLIAGGWLYFLLLSEWTSMATRTGIRLGKRIYRLILKTLYVLMVKPLIFLYKCIKILLAFLLAVTIFLYKFMLQLIYPFQKLLVWLAKISKLQHVWKVIIGSFRKWTNRWKK